MPDFIYDEDHFILLASQATTHDELNAIERLWTAAEDAQRIAALGALRSNSIKMLEAIDRMIGHIDHLAASAGFATNANVKELRAEMGRIHSQLHDPDSDALAHDPAMPDPGSDKLVSEGATTRPLDPSARLDVQTPLSSRNYADLADEYVRFFNGAAIRTSHASKVKKMAEIAWKNRARYESVGAALSIPWWFIAGLHQMESTYNFQTHLHNGDPLTGRTTHVPAGRPATGTPPFTFEESAIDALRQKGFDSETDWSLPRALYRFERYNGFGYRQHGVPSPYLWGFTSIYEKGKYVADGVFDANAVTAQCGVAALLRQLANDGRLKLVSSQFADIEPTDDLAPPSGDGGEITSDTAAASGHPFEAFWNTNLSHIQHFGWKELLFKGASNATHGSNTDPEPEKFANCVPLVNALEEIRNRIGGRMRLLSVYRSKAYNTDVGGASSSRHMEFDAADFHVIDPGHGDSGDWATQARAVRSAGTFEGGIGIYGSFVHIDTRGQRADWDNR